MIGIIDYGLGNLHSVHKAFRRLGADVEILRTPEALYRAEKLILPGVGHFKMGMANLINRGFEPVIREQVMDHKIPLLGICLGMQLLTTYSEEGESKGLNFIKAKTISFKNLKIDRCLKIPHIGWNNLTSLNYSKILEGFSNEMVYFIHSYAVICENPEEVICETNYGITFHSGIQKGNIYGLQFHPEKSHKAGLRILKNFADLKYY